MVVILVVLTIATLLVVDWYLLRGKRADSDVLAVEGRSVQASLLPLDLFLHPGHGWARVSPDGLVAVGADHFAPGFVGEMAAVEVPSPGARLRQGAPAWTLVSRKGRRLTQAMPLDGEVVEVNRELLENPRLAQEAPYAAWIMRVRPVEIRRGLRNLLHGELARSWLDACKSQVTTRFSLGLATVATDGGEWVAAFGDRLDDVTWTGLKKELFPSDEASESPSG